MDFDTGVITNLTKSETLSGRSRFPPFIQNIINKGGLLNSHAKASGKDGWRME